MAAMGIESIGLIDPKVEARFMAHRRSVDGGPNFSKSIIEASKSGGSAGTRAIERYAKLVAAPKLSATEGVNAFKPIEFGKNEAAGPSIANAVKSGIEKVDKAQKAYQSELKKVATGESNSIHRVLAAKEEAKVYLNLMVKTNKAVVDAYREVSKLG